MDIDSITTQTAADDMAQREAELIRRETELERRELRAQAAQLLGERALTTVLADALNYDSSDALHKSIDAAEQAFREAVRQGIEERMRSGVPRAGVADDADDSDAAYYASHYRM